MRAGEQGLFEGVSGEMRLLRAHSQPTKPLPDEGVVLDDLERVEVPLDGAVEGAALGLELCEVLERDVAEVE